MHISPGASIAGWREVSANSGTGMPHIIGQSRPIVDQVCLIVYIAIFTKLLLNDWLVDWWFVMMLTGVSKSVRIGVYKAVLFEPATSSELLVEHAKKTNKRTTGAVSEIPGYYRVAGRTVLLWWLLPRYLSLLAQQPQAWTGDYRPCHHHRPKQVTVNFFVAVLRCFCKHDIFYYF